MSILGLLAVVLLGAMTASAQAAEWQWSAPDGQARAYLWIPPKCPRVRAVVVANHNMIEQGILEHPLMRRTLSDLDIAEVWVVPAMDATFDFHQGAGEHFQRIMNALADQSGYSELRFAPVVPIGHSACATYPWNFAAWNPGRTLAVLSVHGDAPQTTLTGNGKPRIDWGDRNIDGVPGLMVMGEYEWAEDRIAPALAFQTQHPGTPLAMLADAGHGHYDYSDRLVAFLAMFIRKAAAARLPRRAPLDGPVPLTPVNPSSGWRVDRWRKDQPPAAPAAPYAKYAGDPKQAFWCFDGEMAHQTESYYAGSRGKKPQLLSVTDPRAPPRSGCGEPVTPRFLPADDGITFQLVTAFMDTVPGDKKNTNPARWAGLPVGTPLGHATGGGPILLSPSVGPVAQIGPDTFQLRFGRAEFTANGRNNDLWIIAHQPGDDQYKSIVQQVMVRVVPNHDGAPQRLTFPPIPDQAAGTKSLGLFATSDAGMPVHYYVVQGPAEVSGDTLVFTPIPPRAKFPLQVTVVAWQWGRATAPMFQTAEPVTQKFLIVRPFKKK